MTEDQTPVRGVGDGALALGGITEKRQRSALDRIRSPEETLVRARPIMAGAGITRIANLTGLDRIGVPVVSVTRPNSRSVSVALGKGFTLAAAKASGVMEAVESHHAERVDKPLLLDSYGRLRSRMPLVDVDGLPRVSAGFFRANRKLLWIEGYDLMRERSCWVPYELVHCDYTLPFPTGSGAFLMSSNGVASGNHLLEAISHGVCEIVERDGTALWQFASPAEQAASAVDLSSVDDEPCREVLGRFEAAAVEVSVWETTTDVGIPSFRCQVADGPDCDFQRIHPVAGYGCHPRREVALMRALTEAAQGRLTVIAGARDDLSQTLFGPPLQPAGSAMRLPSGRGCAGGGRCFTQAPTHDASTLEADLKWELERLETAGCRQVIVVDLTKPEFGIPVVRVIVPGLESICEAPGYVPGPRLRKHQSDLQ